MKPGRELDKLVAEKVFGYKIVSHNMVGRPDYFYKADDGECCDGNPSLILVPQYSTHIASAWLVVEKFDNYRIDQTGIEERGTVKWFPAAYFIDFKSEKWGSAVGETPAHAICLAALKAVNAI